MTESAPYGKWEVVKPIGRGGQGQVYLVRDTSGFTDAGVRRKNLQNAVNTLGGAAEVWRFQEAGAKLADEIRQIAREGDAPLGALKKLLPIDEGAAEDAAAALERMKGELSTLKSVDHPSLVQVLDSNLDQEWFVMEYLDGGTLSSHLEAYKGRVLEVLRAEQ